MSGEAALQLGVLSAALFVGTLLVSTRCARHPDATERTRFRVLLGISVIAAAFVSMILVSEGMWGAAPLAAPSFGYGIGWVAGSHRREGGAELRPSRHFLIVVGVSAVVWLACVGLTLLRPDWAVVWYGAAALVFVVAVSARLLRWRQERRGGAPGHDA